MTQGSTSVGQTSPRLFVAAAQVPAEPEQPISVWVEIVLRDRWFARLRLAHSAGVVVVAEARFAPVGGAPPGGLTKADLNHLPSLEQLWPNLQESFERMRKEVGPALFGQLLVDTPGGRQERPSPLSFFDNQPGRRRWNQQRQDYLHAVVAVEYATAFSEHGRRFMQPLLDRLTARVKSGEIPVGTDLTARYVSSLIRQARSKGLLTTPAVRGTTRREGGQPSWLAVDLLDRGHRPEAESWTAGLRVLKRVEPAEG